MPRNSGGLAHREHAEQPEDEQPDRPAERRPLVHLAGAVADEQRRRGRDRREREQVRTDGPEQPSARERDAQPLDHPAVEHRDGAQGGKSEREQHDRFLADRRRPEREARCEEHERAIPLAIQGRYALGGGAVEEIAPKNATMPNTKNAAMRSVPIST